jgi:hypothetical protein
MPEQQTLDLAAFGAQRSAVISDCGLYRYRLDRRWAPGPTVAWIMLNPSTADADTDDPTLRRILAFSRGWGFGALRVVNLYAYRATEPADLWRAADPVGPDNDRHIAAAVSCVEVVAAWGANARPDRIAAVLALIARAPGAGRVHALAVTKSGQPRHPLYLAGSLEMQRWEMPDV